MNNTLKIKHTLFLIDKRNNSKKNQTNKRKLTKTATDPRQILSLPFPANLTHRLDH